ncbi:MAG: rane protein [Bacteroidetes bacterium]|nr:rane protein [Bacteroidota bacterium]
MAETTTYTSNSDTSLVKITPVDTLWGKQGNNIYLRTQTTPSKIVKVSGYEGKVAPQGLFTYDTSSGLLLFITLIYSYMFFRSRSVVRGSLNSIFRKQRERSSIFEPEVTAPEVRFRALVRILGVIGLTVYAYTFVADLVPHSDNLMALLLLVALGVGIIFFLWIKYLIFLLLSFVFFDRKQTVAFIHAYFTIIFGLGLLLLPLVAFQTLVAVDFIPWLQTTSIIACVVVVLLVLYKIVQIFWLDYYSIVYIIVYLCTLEILPVLVGLRVMQLFDISL